MSDSKHRNSVTPRPSGSTSTPHPASSSKAATPSPASSKTSSSKPAQHSSDTQKSGRVAYDARGNPVWEWQTSTGVFEQDVSTQRLKKLEAPELSFAETQPVPVIGNGAAAKPKLKSKEDTGFNPYNSDGPINPQTDRRAVSHPALVHKKPPPHRAPPRHSEPAKPTGMWDKLKSRF